MSGDGQGQNGAFTIFHFFAVICALAVVATAIKSGWDVGGATGVVAALVIVLVFAPLALVVGFAGSLLGLMMLAFVGNHEPPPGLWIGRIHRVARGLVIAACVASIVHFVPHLLASPNWRSWKDEDKLGVLLPICMIIFFCVSKFEARAARGPEEG